MDKAEGLTGRDVACDHCGLPVPAALREPDAERQFCCNGCRTVWAVIHEHGFERYYELARELPGAPEPARTTGRGYEEFDDPAFRKLYVRERSDGSCVTELYLEGVHCAACVWLVERVPVAVPGAVEVRLDMGRSRAEVVWDPRRTSLSTIARLLDSMGYPAHPFRGVRVREMRRREDRALLIRIGVAGASAGNVMMIAFALYGGMLHGMEPGIERFFRQASLVMALPAVLWSAAVFYRGAWGSLRTRSLHMDVPITIGILAGTVWGAVNTFRAEGEIYFDSVTALIFLLLVGRYLQQRRQRGAADAAELLYSLAPSSARRIEPDGSTRAVPLEAIAPGARVEVRAGETVPVDGSIAAGRSGIDVSLLTGESRPVPVGPGEVVHAGTVNLSSRIVVEVLAAGESTRVGRLMRMVEEGARRKAPVVRLADRVSAWFVLVVLALAALTLGLWWSVDPTRAFDHAIALLIVTCPCALGLATPLALSAAIGQAGRQGILIKGADALERLARPGRLLLDKTGTLTEGRVALERWWGDEGVKPLVAVVEAHSAHPVARALSGALGDEAAARSVPVEVERASAGAGIVGRVEGHELAVGSPAFVEGITGGLPAAAARAVDAFVADGLTPVLIARDREVVAGAGLGDPPRADAATTLARLRRAGWKLAVLSGDHPGVVAAVGRRLGLETAELRGGVLPEQKLEAVERASRGGETVVMVGDGINDSAALSAAGVGVAVHGGAEVAMSVADVFLARPGLRPLGQLVDGARRVMNVIRWNLVFSLAYNVVGAGLAMAGWIGPLAAAILMPLSSLTVITLSYRARTFGGGADASPRARSRLSR